MPYKAQPSSTLSAKDAMKAQMDALLGRDRNLSSEEKARRNPHFSDAEHNKNFLVGLCPYELFKNTKDDIGPPPQDHGRICDDKMKQEYDKLSQAEKDKYGYEFNLFVLLRRLVADLDRRIQRSQERLADQEREARAGQEKLLAQLSSADLRRHQEISDKLSELTNDAERLGMEGDVDGALALVTQCDQLRSEQRQIQRKLPRPLEDTSNKKLLLCDVSGNFLSCTDSAERMRNHYEGKRYLGWKKIREKYSELRAKNLSPGVPGWNPKRAAEEAERQKRRAANGSTSSNQDAGSRSGTRDRAHHRDRDRDRGRDRDRDRRGGGGGGGGRDADRDRTRSDRHRDHRSSRRSRSRSRDRRTRR